MKGSRQVLVKVVLFQFGGMATLKMMQRPILLLILNALYVRKFLAVESGSPEKVPGKGAFYYINHDNSGTFSGLPDSTAHNFEAS